MLTGLLPCQAVHVTDNQLRRRQHRHHAQSHADHRVRLALEAATQYIARAGGQHHQ